MANSVSCSSKSEKDDNRHRQLKLPRLDCEIQLYDIKFTQSVAMGETGTLICGDIIKTHSIIKPIEEKAYPFSEKDFFDGLRAWLTHYDQIRGVFDIWKKTIYNDTVSKEDIFIWRCQSFELLCSLNDDVWEDAKKLMTGKQKNPNLVNLITAVSHRYIIGGSSIKHFGDVKAVRDKLTHNNPKKTVSEAQVENAFQMIKYFLIAATSKIVDFKCQYPSLYIRES